VVLPDGRLAVVEEDAITGVESLFDPSVLGQCRSDDAARGQGLRPALHLAYTRSDLDLRTEMCKNVLLVGSLAPAMRPAVLLLNSSARTHARTHTHTHTHTHAHAPPHTHHRTRTHDTPHRRHNHVRR
jgi:hypothetical protein